MNKLDKKLETGRSRAALLMARKLAKRLISLRRSDGSGVARGPHLVSVTGAEGVEVPHGSPLLASLVASGLQINHFCGGNGSCGTCKFEVIEGLANLQRPTTAEIVGGAASEPTRRLACQARILGPITIRVKM